VGGAMVVGVLVVGVSGGVLPLRKPTRARITTALSDSASKSVTFPTRLETRTKEFTACASQ